MQSHKSSCATSGKRRKPKCTRGKKVCPACSAHVPIHCFECICGHKFEIKRKRKDDALAVAPTVISEIFKPTTSLSFDTLKNSPFEMYLLSRILHSAGKFELKEGEDVQFIVTSSAQSTSLSVKPGSAAQLCNGHTNNKGTDFSLLVLPFCRRVIKLDWVGPGQLGTTSRYFWVLYETDERVSCVAVLRLDVKDKLLLSSSIQYLCPFKSFIPDADCNGFARESNNVLTMFATLQNIDAASSRINFYNLPIQVSQTEPGFLPLVTLSEINSMKIMGKIEQFAWNKRDPSMIVVSDAAYNIYVINAENSQFLRIYFHAHTMEMTGLIWIHGHECGAENGKDYIASSSHDGNIKLWDLEDPFAPCYVHSTGQV